MCIWCEEQPECLALTQRKCRVPIFIAGVNVNGLTGVKQFKPGFFRFPGSRRGLACKVKRRLQCIRRGLYKGESPRGTGTQVEVQKERGIRTRAGRGTAGQKENRIEVT